MYCDQCAKTEAELKRVCLELARVRGELNSTKVTNAELVKEIEKLVRERDEATSNYYDAQGRYQRALVEAIELRAQLAEAQRDAARYKWLRDVWWLGDDYFDTPDPMAHANSADEFDAAIDEARIPRASVVEHHAPHCDLNKPSSFVKCTCGYERIARAGG